MNVKNELLLIIVTGESRYLESSFGSIFKVLLTVFGGSVFKVLLTVFGSGSQKPRSFTS
jgi:hypothetical protein